LSISCEKSEKPLEKEELKLFSSLPAFETGIRFQNKLTETVDANYFQYNYSYIGADVAASDFNNDGLEDLFFTSNSYDNKLYLNKGNLKFEDITKKTGIKKRPIKIAVEIQVIKTPEQSKKHSDLDAKVR